MMKKIYRSFISVSIMGVLVVSLMWAFMGQGGCAMRENPDKKIVDLPEPVFADDVSFEEALTQRRSVRRFTDEPIRLSHLSGLLWAAQGVTDRRGFRTAPSAGALYPLEVYVVTGGSPDLSAGIYRYVPDSHRLESIKEEDSRSELSRAGLGQGVIGDAPLSIVISGVLARTTGKYGQRGVNYVFIEAGHAAQNLLLKAVTLGLGGVPIGAFDDSAVGRLLNMADGERPLYIIPTGYPAE